MTFKLRDYQVQAIASVRNAIREGKKRVIISLPTGGGKTLLSIGVILSAVSKGNRVVFICNRIHLIEQASQVFALHNISFGVIQGDNTRYVDRQVIIASIQTVINRGMPDVDLIIIDEAHFCAGDNRLIKLLVERNNVPVIGLSATPFSKGLGRSIKGLDTGLFEDVVVAATIPGLIEQGHLVDCDVYAPSEPDMQGIKTRKNIFGEVDWADTDVAKAADKQELIGDIISHWVKLANGCRTIVFASSIPHSHHITERFRAIGVSAEHIDCYMNPEEKQKKIERFKLGDITVLSNVALLGEGLDVPACKCVILARPTKSLIRYLQMVGRALRPYEGFDKALLLDHSGTVARLGFPTDEREIELDDGTNKKSKQKKKEEPLPRKCPSCSFMMPPKSPFCPSCGYKSRKVHDVVETGDELVKQEKTAKKKVEDKQEFYSMLLHIQKARGYSDGWKQHTYKEYFGVWAKGMKDVPLTPNADVLNFVRHKNIKFSKSNHAKIGV